MAVIGNLTSCEYGIFCGFIGKCLMSEAKINEHPVKTTGYNFALHT